MEKWDILNSFGEVVGKMTVRGETPLKFGEYHLVVHIWVVSSDGKFLIQRRSKEKKLMPGEWAATGGSAICGETSFCAAYRELIEELGIRLNARESKCMSRIKKRNAFVDLWFTKSDVDASSLILQKSEVSQVKWVTKQELINMIKNGEFHNYGKEYFDTVFSCAEGFINEFEN